MKCELLLNFCNQISRKKLRYWYYLSYEIFILEHIFWFPPGGKKKKKKKKRRILAAKTLAQNHVALNVSHGCSPRVMKGGYWRLGHCRVFLASGTKRGWVIQLCLLSLTFHNFQRPYVFDHHVGPFLSMVQWFTYPILSHVLSHILPCKFHTNIYMNSIFSLFCFVSILIGRGILRLSNINLGLGSSCMFDFFFFLLKWLKVCNNCYIAIV